MEYIVKDKHLFEIHLGVEPGDRSIFYNGKKPKNKPRLVFVYSYRIQAVYTSLDFSFQMRISPSKTCCFTATRPRCWSLTRCSFASSTLPLRVLSWQLRSRTWSKRSAEVVFAAFDRRRSGRGLTPLSLSPDYFHNPKLFGKEEPDQQGAGGWKVSFIKIRQRRICFIGPKSIKLYTVHCTLKYTK